MKPIVAFAALLLLLSVYTSCSSNNKEEKVADFCTTGCNTDTLKAAADDKAKSFIRINLNNCEADSITWGNQLMDAYRQLPFPELVGKYVSLSESYVQTKFVDGKYAWLIFNECKLGQGYIVKLPFNKTDNIFRKNSAFNAIDPKYKVDESLVAYTDRGNIFVEEITTGKTASMTFGVQTEMEYNAMHETVDSVHITPSRIWAKVKIGKEWKELEKDIILK